MKIGKLIKVDIIKARAISLDIIQSKHTINPYKSDGLTSGEYVLEIPKSVTDEVLKDVLKLEPNLGFKTILQLIRSEYFKEAEKKTKGKMHYPLFSGKYITPYYDCDITKHNSYWNTTLIQTNLRQIEETFNKEVEEARQRALVKMQMDKSHNDIVDNAT